MNLLVTILGLFDHLEVNSTRLFWPVLLLLNTNAAGSNGHLGGFYIAIKDFEHKGGKGAFTS